MKISVNNRPYFFPQQNDMAKAISGERGTQKTGGKFDAVQISQSQNSTSDDKFISTLREKIMAEVAKPTPPQQLETIKGQINANTYSLNLEEVARRIMMA